ncbi:ADP-ribosylation factor-like protein 5A, partial [Limulus polyphemus]|uniref:ADP-ribosylation factor-like protein 5A n=1 Tax=Limulus polyphemus TaxID=6850 RepID=A0ABM1C122_LIMPO
IQHKSTKGKVAYHFSVFQFLIVVVDSTDREKLPVTKEELWKMLSHEELNNTCVLVYANKQDLKGCMTPAEISEQLKLTSLKKHRWRIQACCALTGEGLYQGLEWIYYQLKSKK